MKKHAKTNNSESSSDDQDYVPSAKALKLADKETGTVVDKQLTGIDLVKEVKRIREVDDLFDLMNQEDDFYAKKRQKTDVTATDAPVVNIKAKTEIEAKPELTTKSKDDKSTFDAAMAAIKMMNSKAVVTEKIKFAGQTFTSSRTKTSDDIRKEQLLAKTKLGGACEALDSLVQ